MKKCSLFILFGLLTATVFLASTHKVSALSNKGPDPGEYGGASVDFTLSNTYDVKYATEIVFPIYYQNRPGGGGIDVHANFDLGSGCVQFAFTKSVPSGTPCIGKSSSSTGTIHVAQSRFSFDSTTNLWTAYFYAHLPGGVSANNYKNFNLSIPTSFSNLGYIGYSNQNTPSFAIADNQRCDPGGDNRGCGKYYDYGLPFGAKCSQASGTQTITIYDGDNPSGSAPYGIQPLAFQPELRDVTDGYPGTRVTLHGSGSYGSNQHYYLNFTFTQGHRYVFRLGYGTDHLRGVYSNNDLQFRLPFDSIYSTVSCQWSVQGTTKLYATASDGSCSSSAHGKQLPDGYQVTQGSSAQYLCYYNSVTNNKSSMESTDLVEGIRYTTYDPGGGGAWIPQLINQNGTHISPPAVPRDSTNDAYNIVYQACDWPNLPNSGLPAHQTVPPYSYWSSPIMETDPDFSAQGGVYVCNNYVNAHSYLAPDDTSANTYTWRRVKIPANTPVGTKYCEWIAFSPYYKNVNGTVKTNGYSKSICFSIKAPPVNLTCDDLSDTLGDEEANTKFNFTVTVEAHTSDYSGGLNVTFTPAAGVTQYGSASSSGSTYTSATYKASPGTYTVKYDIGGNPPGGCSQTIHVGYEPYFGVLGGDVSAGVPFGSGICVMDTSADIESWNNDNSPPPGSSGVEYKGAGSQLAAFAGGQIAHFITSTKPDNSGYDNVGNVTAQPYALSFANFASDGSVTATDGGPYGGGFGSLPCMHDYYTPPPTSGENDAVNYNKSGTYYESPSARSAFVVDLGSSCLADGVHITINVAGTVYIPHDIYYATNPNCPWSNKDGSPSLQHIPSLDVNATGGIYLSGSVQRIHGTFEAYGSRFATCATYSGGVVTETTVFGTCNQALDVYGSVMAKYVDLDRSFQSLNSGGPAETFHYTPESWLPNGQDCITTNDCSYDAFTSLPPTL